MSTQSPLLRKLWLASVIQGHRNPFGKPLPDYTIAELDFVLEMAAQDDPERYSFRRAGQPENVRKAASEIAAAWLNVRAGAALKKHMAASGFAAAMDMANKWYSRKKPGLQPGVTRGGKDISDAWNSRTGQ